MLLQFRLLLADRTNGPAYASVVSVCRL